MSALTFTAMLIMTMALYIMGSNAMDQWAKVRRDQLDFEQRREVYIERRMEKGERERQELLDKAIPLLHEWVSVLKDSVTTNYRPGAN